MAGERRRSLTKNTSNYISLGVGGLGALLSTLAAFTVHAKIRARSFTGGLNDNNILTAIINGTSAGMVFAVSGTTSTIRCRLRSVSTDALQSLSAATALSVDVDYFVQLTVNVGAPALALFLNGTSDATSTPTFGNPTWTLGTPTGSDAVGGFNAPSAATTDQWDGLISDLALWNVILSGADLTSLGGGADPATINTAQRIWKLPMNGTASPEVSTTGSLNGTITGDVPVYPPIERLTRGMRMAA